MILKLQQYNISLVYKRGKDHHIADALSRAYQDHNEFDSSNNDVPKEEQHYYSFRDELTVVNNIILSGQLHKGHHGMDATMPCK